MTEANEGRPLTRRELRERERAAELERTGGIVPVPDEEARRRLEQEPARTGRHSTPSVPAAAEDRELIDAAPGAEAAEPVEEVSPAEPASVATEQAPDASRGSKRTGRFFGRRRAQEPVAEQAEQARAEQAPAEPARPLEETVAIETVDADELDGEIVVAEPADDAPASVPAPSSARPASVPVDDVQGLDTVDEAEVDRLEIDEVSVEDRPVSAHRIAESTPAELEDRRSPVETDEHAPTGPSRGQSQRLPVIVNVVSDTSEHHIADLREQGVAGSSGPSSSSFTANALVLPAGSDSPEFQLEGEDGVLVTGSIDVPEGFASSGRGRATIDGSDLDAEVADGEVQSPDAAPVRASRAVSSYANARVQIAPKKQPTNAWPIAIGVGAGAVAASIAGFLWLALNNGWL